MDDEIEAPRRQGLTAPDAVKLVYVLYLAGFFVPLCALAGVIVAYAKREAAGPVEASHFVFQIRSFWIGLLVCVVGGFLTLLLVGYLVLGLWVAWALARFVTGLMAALERRPVRDPEGYGPFA